MENQKLLKILKKTAIIFIIAVVFLFLAWFGLSKYGEWRFNKDLQVLITEQNRPYLEDVYGGKTPKETLELFIAAVEKEDFELASKYFVLSKQEEWRDRLIKINTTGKLDEFMKPVLEENSKLEVEVLAWEELESYVTGDDVLFEFIKYPQGNWKIREI